MKCNMSAEINYKNKYMELRSRYMDDLEMSFRLGFEQGGQQAQQDQMMQQQQQAQEVEMAAAQGMAQGQPGQPGQPGAGGPEQPPQPGQEAGAPQGSELDQHISKLEGMIAKAENLTPEELSKSINDLKQLQKNWKEQADLRKSAEAIKGIAKALHKPQFKLTKQASINLNSTAKAAVSMQHQIVNDVMKKMEEEEKRAGTDIKKLLAEITKG